MFTYGAAGKDMNPEMLKNGGLQIDECYTTSDNAFKFTLVHLKQRKRISSINKFMDYAAREHGIVSQSIFGYESTSSYDGREQIHDHPGIRILLDHMNKELVSFSMWTEARHIHGGGLLMTFKRQLENVGTFKSLLHQPINQSVTVSALRATPPVTRLPKSKQSIEFAASKIHPLLVEQLFNPEMLAEVEKWDLIEQTLKEDHNENDYEPACQGSVYFASTPTLPGILKIGGTKFDGATRVRQLYTAGVPERYTCRFEFRCPDWKLFEGVVHEITKVNRLYKRKELFVMQPEAAAKLIDQIKGLIPMTFDEQLEWDAAFKKITVRLQKSRANWAKAQSKRTKKEEDWAAAMDKLTEENASLRAQLRSRPTESTE